MSLLSEIVGRAPAHGGSLQNSMHDLRADVIAEVETLFGVVRGSMPGDPEYGIGDVTLIYESRQDAGKSWCAETQEALRRYVPRIQRARVTQVPSDRLDLTFRVKIAGQLVANGRLVPVEFEAAAFPQRSWKVA